MLSTFALMLVRGPEAGMDTVAKLAPLSQSHSRTVPSFEHVAVIKREDDGTKQQPLTVSKCPVNSRSGRAPARRSHSDASQPLPPNPLLADKQSRSSTPETSQHV